MKTGMETEKSTISEYVEPLGPLTSLIRSKGFEYISLSPMRELNFILSKSIYQSNLTITNISSEATAIFRLSYSQIRVTNAAFYSVHPTAGVIFPKQKKTINITFVPKTPITERFDDKFLVQAYQYFGGDLPDEKPTRVLQMFHDFSGSSKAFQNLRLKVHFDVNSASQSQSTEGSIFSPSNKYKFDPEKQIAELDEIGSPSRVKSVINSSPITTFSTLRLKTFLQEKNGNQETQESSPQDQTTLKEVKIVSEQQIKSQIGLYPLETEFKQKQDMNQIMGDSRRKYLEKAVVSSPETSKSIFGSPGGISKQNNQDNDEGIQEENNKEKSCMSISKQSDMYERKCMQLSRKLKQQRAVLLKVSKERDDFLNEMNKLKFTFPTEKTAPEAKVANTYQAKKFELWQLMFVSIIFLIIGSCLR